MILALRISALVVAAAIASCALSPWSSLRPLTERPRIAGRQARQVAVVLTAPFSFGHWLATYTLPAGRYSPTLEDDAGVYFPAPTKILATDIFTAPSLYDGGLYFRTDGSSEIDQYVLVRNQPLFTRLPADFRYSLSQ